MNTSSKSLKAIQIGNKEHQGLDERVAQVIERSSAGDLVAQIRKDIPYELLVCKNIQENHDIYRAI